MPETVIFNGVKFRRYPESKHRSDRVYFTPLPADKDKGVGRLHVEIWKEAHGPIPPGSHIHHRDENPLNNDLANLVCVTPKRHAEAHLTPERSEQKRQHMANIQPLTKAWHASPEGLEWHRQHAYTTIRAMEPVEHTCDQCGQSFVAIPKKPNRFCSNACKSAWRRASGLDDETRECVICGNAFTINRYAPATTCSRACRGVKQSRTKAAKRLSRADRNHGSERL